MNRPLRLAGRSVLSAVLLVAAVEAFFVPSSTGSVLVVPYWNGVPRGILINGAVVGTLYGLVALGLVLVHKATRVINFAQAAMGSFPALAGLLLVAGRGWPHSA